MPRPDLHLNKHTAKSSAAEIQKVSPLSPSSLFSFFPIFFHRCQKRFHGLCVCVNLPHPFWVLIYPFRFNLPVSGFPHPLIRLWGVDTNTKHTQTSRHAHKAFFFSRFHTRTHMHMYTQPTKVLQNHSPRLETRFAKTVLISPRWASFTLWLASAAPVTKTGHREKGRRIRKGKKKKVRYSVVVRGQREVPVVKAFISELFFFPVSNLFVKLKLH